MLTRKSLAHELGLLSCATPLFFSSCNMQQEPNRSRPNIIYILADDLGYGDIKAMSDSSLIPTPNLDKMIARGISFTDAHSNSSVSTPTRYGTLTGRYAFRTRLKSGALAGHEPALIEPGRETAATLLRKNGYKTACIGKWHLGLDWERVDAWKPLYEGWPWDLKETSNVDYTKPVKGGPDEHGFDYSYILPASLDIQPYVYIENGKLTSSNLSHIEEWQGERGEWFRQGDVADNFSHQDCLQHFADRAVKYLEEETKTGEPYFLYFPITAPHTPWMPTEEFRGKSGAGIYGDFVCMVDDVVGQIYEALEKSGNADNTLVIFTSDNGSHWKDTDIAQYGHKANGVLKGMKSDLWEGGHRIPFIATWPEVIEPGQTSDQMVCSTDFLATCAAITNTPLAEDAGEDSYSFFHALKGEEDAINGRKTMIYHSADGHFGFRSAQWALLACKGSGGWSLFESNAQQLPDMQLYDLSDDIRQERNLFESHPAKAAEMKELLDLQIASGRSRM